LGGIAGVKCCFTSCKRIPEPGRKLCSRCAARANKRRKQRIANRLCNNCTRPADFGKKRCTRCREWSRVYSSAHKVSKQQAARYRKIVFDFYGGLCVCCGEANRVFLTIDHINGRTLEQKTERGERGYFKFARAILKDKPRTDIRILCYNCNCGRERNGGVCPHQDAA